MPSIKVFAAIDAETLSAICRLTTLCSLSDTVLRKKELITGSSRTRGAPSELRVRQTCDVYCSRKPALMARSRAKRLLG